MTQLNDETYWVSELNVRLFSHGFYSNYFVGYNTSYATDYAPMRGYTFSDDLATTGKQVNFENQPPASRATTSETAAWMSGYAGPTWNFSWVRKSNLFIDRIEGMKGSHLTDEEYNHWSAVARFFRGFEYSRLVSVFGDVPYYENLVGDNELDELYKDRDDRGVVMDKVYDDFVYAMENMRVLDGGSKQNLNKFIAASFISRFMLFEGTWQKYHEADNEKAQKYLQLAVEAGDLVINSGLWSFGSDFRSLFGSQDLSGNSEVILYRHYDAALVKHSIASYSNVNEGQSSAANLDLARSFIATDGLPYQLSTVPDANKLDIDNMIKTRDPRFEATFWDVPLVKSATLLYSDKFIDRIGPTYAGSGYPPMYGSNTNTNDAPVMRLAEVALNWIEAKAELATLGGVVITQGDLDVSINAIRDRPLDAVAIAKGVVKTSPLNVSSIPNDPNRDPDVPELLWEIRRERRMEFVHEHTRLLDIKRWKKLNNMDGSVNPDILLGPWVDFPNEMPEFLVPEKEGILKIEKEDGTVITYDGANPTQMVGFYVPENISNRDPFSDRVYMAPVGENQISEYAERGYTLSQTTGW
ncbi:RagB/SusD family nutrient uptake outer membrane protein [Flexithrix dorotheae]|uniref:RagB/SusD family nutrient uptake outer membrane protein n=1 Tax=Flexithrix dorotheae TaxID=70993 RepID=UPI0003A73EC3|nr:RagB/SusD family nutrient uptake outer membrane protein [Flexithrix dorotheae]